VGPPGASLRALHLTLRDDVTGACHPVHHLAWDGGPWRSAGALTDGSHVLLYHRRPLPRAWLAAQVIRLAEAEVAQAIVSGQLPDGSEFEPYKTALVEEDVPFAAGRFDPGATAGVTRHEPHRVTVTTQAAGEALLVLGDVHYPGWQARVDGRPA